MRSAVEVRGREPAVVDPRARRRAERARDNRDTILDAAEQVFGRRGLEGGSVREIAAAAGFSPAALYLFFDNKQQLVAETLLRRAAELLAVLQAAVAGGESPLDQLHTVVDASIAFFDSRPDFRRLLGHTYRGGSSGAPSFAGYAEDSSGQFSAAMDVLVEVIAAGQRSGDVRSGDPRALTYFYTLLINEHVFLRGDAGTASLTGEQFHDIIDGLLRPTPTVRPTPPARRRQREVRRGGSVT